MERNLQILFCDIQSDLYQVLEFFDKNQMLNTVVDIESIIKKVNQMHSLIKDSKEDIKTCIDLLSMDGIGSKSIVRSILIKIEVDIINANQPLSYYSACLSGDN